LTIKSVFVTDVYSAWLRKLKRKDPRAAARIQVRVDRLISGNPGDTGPIGEGLSELRIHHGPGYRVYFWQQSEVLLILLCSGTKATQIKDIQRAHELARQWKDDGDKIHPL